MILLDITLLIETKLKWAPLTDTILLKKGKCTPKMAHQRKKKKVIYIHRLLNVKSLISFLFNEFLIPYRERTSPRAIERCGIKNE